MGGAVMSDTQENGASLALVDHPRFMWGFDRFRRQYLADEMLADDGPLSDLSVLVQIPKVRELAEAAVRWERQAMWAWDDGELADDADTLAWLNALEATEGDA